MPTYHNPRMVDRTCKCCKRSFQARAADVKRGWGRFCSKSCKAIKQEQRTGATAAFRARERNREEDDGYDLGWDAHKDY